MNAKMYNQPHTIFYKYAVELEKFAKENLENLKEENMFDDCEDKPKEESKKGRRKKKDK